MGRNHDGRLGIGHTTERNQPVLVESSGIANVSKFGSWLCPFYKNRWFPLGDGLMGVGNLVLIPQRIKYPSTSGGVLGGKYLGRENRTVLL